MRHSLSIASIGQDFTLRVNRMPVRRIRPRGQNPYTYRVPQVHRKPSDSILPVLRRPHYIQSHGICLHTIQIQRAPIALQTSQRYWEHIPHSVPSLQTQTLTYGAPSVFIWSCPAILLVSSRVLPLFPIFFSASLLLCVYLLRLTWFVYLSEALSLCSQ